LRVVVPEAALLAAPFLVYGTIAFLALRAWPLAARLGAAAALLGLHAGLVALHAVAYVALWSLPAPAALRLAHRWSPLVPLLQLLWVPLLALPLMTLAARRRRPAPPRKTPTRIPVEVLVARAARAAPQARPRPDPRGEVEPPRPEPVPEAGTEVAAAATIAVPAPPSVAAVVTPPPVAPVLARPEAPASPIDAAIPLIVAAAPEAIAEAAPEAIAEAAPEVIEVSPPPEHSRAAAPIAPAPTWFDELLEASARSVPPAEPSPVPSCDAYVIDDALPIQAPGPVAEGHGPEILPERVEPVATGPAAPSPEPLALVPPAPVTPEDAVPDDVRHAASAVMAPMPVETAVPPMPVVAAVPRVARPPLDLDLVTRAFAPYGPLLSRDREVQVEWIPGPGLPVVCVAPREMSRDRVTRLAARLRSALDSAPPRPGPEAVRRLSLRDSGDVIVLTPLDGAVLAAAARRRGAVALLEAISARLAPAAGDRASDARTPDALAAVTVGGSSGVHVETSAAALEVFAPAEVDAVPVGELVGRLLAALAADGGGLETLQDLTVSLGACRLAVHPVHPAGHPPRFVLVVGGSESPGLLGRRAERAARALRVAS
jgi:hypothetical protein